ncbi:MAG: S-layer homology domain-containing protein [Oscillibacter sp.]|nr:S-layer homology domain-containing protein [Oscillibacter sp.]
MVAPEHGTVTTSLTRAASGTRITVTATPDSDYAAQGVTVRTSAGKDVSVTANADGTFEYVQPASDVVVTATFAKDAPETSGTPGSSDSDTPGGSSTDGGTPDSSSTTDGGTPGDSNSTHDTEHPVPPDETGVSDWLVTDSHPVYIRGFTDGTFRPYGNVTRAQVAMMFYRLLKNQSVSGDAFFSDMTGNEWYAEAVYTLSKLGIVQGYRDGTFHGNDSISRAAFTAIASRFLKVNGQTLTGSAQFSDVPETHWAHDVIARAASYGWIGGYEDGTFRPAAPITRAATTAIINRMLNRAADVDYVEAHFDQLQTFTDTPDHSAWYFYNMIEASNEHTFSRDDGSERWN